VQRGSAKQGGLGRQPVDSARSQADPRVGVRAPQTLFRITFIQPQRVGLREVTEKPRPGVLHVFFALSEIRVVLFLRDDLDKLADGRVKLSTQCKVATGTPRTNGRAGPPSLQTSRFLTDISRSPSRKCTSIHFGSTSSGSRTTRRKELLKYPRWWWSMFSCVSMFRLRATVKRF
jgi:hypothetical protein